MLKTIPLILLLISSITLAAETAHFHFIREIPIGGEGGWDYVSVDSVARKLYMSHATKVVVIDLEKNIISGEILDTPGVHGFAIASELGRGFSSNGKENKVNIVDLSTLKTISKVPTGENPDAIVYESGQQEVYAFNGRGKSVTIIQGKTGVVVATLELPGKPEFAAVDAKAHRVYIDIEDKSLIVSIDSLTHKIVATWPIAPGETPTAIAIDVKNHRLFLGCENQKMVMMDSATGKIIDTVPIGKGVDATVFDPATQFVFNSNGEGTVTVVREVSPENLAVVQTIQTQKGARTMALDEKTHQIYLPTAQFEALPPGSLNHRPKLIAGTQKLLVYGP